MQMTVLLVEHLFAPWVAFSVAQDSHLTGNVVFPDPGGSFENLASLDYLKPVQLSRTLAQASCC